MDKMDHIQELLREFIKERNWEKYHTPKNLSMAITIEAAELMEHFNWCDFSKEELEKDKLKEISYEMADILHFLLRLADILNIDLYKASLEKIELNKKRFPISEAKNIKRC
ncbi:MAG: nucleotide pyrophosphohydrolase [Epsilonproteobacteria bacterium]|nr:nucleotide pyrophosphohydrolase [Campylobacterota bacterium]